jgi:hypothetical protein
VLLVYDSYTKGYYPAAFVLCTSRKYSVYFLVVRLVLDATDYTMDPEFIDCDFESAMVRALCDNFPDVPEVECVRMWLQPGVWRVPAVR